jgi:hypothetical protein
VTLRALGIGLGERVIVGGAKVSEWVVDSEQNCDPACQIRESCSTYFLASTESGHGGRNLVYFRFWSKWLQEYNSK